MNSLFFSVAQPFFSTVKCISNRNDKAKESEKHQKLCKSTEHHYLKKLANPKTVVQDIHVSFERIDAQVGERLLVVSSRWITQAIIILRKTEGEMK